MTMLRMRKSFLCAAGQCLFSLVIGLNSGKTFGQSEPTESFHSARIGIAAGMGVNYHDAPDIVNRINGSGVINQRVGDFKSGVEFFGSISLPLARAWVVKGEYEYLLSSYSLPSSFGYGTAEFSYVVHMPTVIVQYILYEAPTYNLKAGAGIGYHFGTYTEKYSNVDASFSGKGIGSLLELEGNTALGDHLCAYLGIQSRWDFIGELKDELGKPPSNSTRTTFHFFSVSARLGMSYYF